MIATNTDSQSRQLITILKRSLGALMALIGGLLMVAIGVFLLLMAVFTWNPGTDSSHNLLNSLFVLPLVTTLLTTEFAFFAAAPIWLFLYLPCHVLIPRDSVFWRPWICVSIGALTGAAAIWVELFITTSGQTLSDGAWMQYDEIMAACVGASTCLAGSWIVSRSEKRRRPSGVAS